MVKKSNVDKFLSDIENDVDGVVFINYVAKDYQKSDSFSFSEVCDMIPDKVYLLEDMKINR